MRLSNILGASLLAAVFFSAEEARAQPVAMSARQQPAGTFRVLGFYQATQNQDLNFTVSGNGTCAAGATPPASNVSFPCGADGDIEAEGDGGAVVFKFLYQPWENLQYYATVGVGDYSMRVASISVVNSLSGDRPGYLYGMGVRALLWPDTEVKDAFIVPALAVDGSVGFQRYYFNELQPAQGAAIGGVDQRLDLLQLQLALETSHLFKFEGTRWGVEPYGGLKWIRTEARLKDLRAGGRAGGMQDTVTPFLGLGISPYENESFFAEASFVNGIQYAAGLNVRFK